MCVQDLLSDLPAQMEFLILVAAYNNSHKPGFVPPAVNGRELDLYTVRQQQEEAGVAGGRGGSSWVCMPMFGCVLRALGLLVKQVDLHA